MHEAMADRVARALNLLGADRDLFDSADGNSLLDLIGEYLDDSEGTAPPFNYYYYDIVAHYCKMYDTILSTVDLDDSVAASSRAPPEVAPEVAENPDPLEVESSLGQLDEDPEEEPVRDDPTAAEIVQAGVTGGQMDVTTIPIDQRDLDVTEEQIIQKFVRDGCKCDLGPNHSSCSSSIPVDHFRSVRCQMADLTNDELDLVIMGQVMAGCFSAETFRKQERSRSFTLFHHGGTRICQKTFLFLHTIGYARFKAIKASFMANGVRQSGEEQ